MTDARWHTLVTVDGPVTFHGVPEEGPNGSMIVTTDDGTTKTWAPGQWSTRRETSGPEPYFTPTNVLVPMGIIAALIAHIVGMI